VVIARRRALRGAATAAAALVALGALGALHHRRRGCLVLSEAAVQRPTGTAPRPEREFKLRVFPAENQPATHVAAQVRAALARLFDEPRLWRAPKLTGQPYYLTGAGAPSMYRDIYLDDEAGTLRSRGAMLRLRHRWKSRVELEGFLLGLNARKSQPTRAEVQSKYGCTRGEGGARECLEPRLEFRVESLPYSELSPPPPAPWPARKYLRLAAAGRLPEGWMWPVVGLARELARTGAPDRLRLEPVVAIYSERWRFHGNIVSPWGSGPNPNQAFIITLDVFTAKRPDAMELAERIEAWPRLPPPLYEIEIEFERNVSSSIDHRNIAAPLEAFLADQATLTREVARALEGKGLRVVPDGTSKFERGLELAGRP
jgi:hypothetical protein